MAEQTTPAEPTTADLAQYMTSPAAAMASAIAEAANEEVAIRELPFRTMISLRAAPGSAAATAIAEAAGIALPTTVGEVAGDDRGEGAAILWIGPDEQLLVAPAEHAGGRVALSSALKEALGEEPGQVVDLSANRTILELSGPKARAVLEKSVAVDLHDRAFEVGTAVATLAGSFPILLWRTDVETWRTLPRASFAHSFAEWLLDGAAEFSGEGGGPASDTASGAVPDTASGAVPDTASGAQGPVDAGGAG